MPPPKRQRTDTISISYLDAKFLPKRLYSVTSEKDLDRSRTNSLTASLLSNDEALGRAHEEEEISHTQTAWLLVKSAFPSLTQGIAANIAFSTLVYFVSLQKNTRLIGAVGLGSTLYFTGIVAFLQALNIGLSALGSQAYGAKDPHLLGVYFKRAVVIQLLVFFPLAAVVSQIALVFRLVGFHPTLASDIESVLVAMIPAALPFTYFDAAKNYLVSQKIFGPQGYIQAISSFLDVPLQYLLIVRFDLGVLGIGIARFCMECSRAFAIYIYIRFSERCQESNIPWQRACFQELWTQFKYQISAGSLQIIDVVGAQIILLQAGYFAAEIVAGNVIVTRVTKFCLIWTLSVGVALSSFIGNSMGEQNIRKVRVFIKVGIIIDFVLICLMWLFLGTQSRNIALIFSNDATVINYASGLLLFFMTITPFDNLQNVLGGILRSVGKEKQSTRLYFFTYYPISIPLSIVLAHYTRLGIYGLYAAMLVAKSLNTVGSIYLLWTMDIRRQMKYVIKRVKASNLKIQEAEAAAKKEEEAESLDDSIETRL